MPTVMRIELGVVGLAPLLGGRHLQHHRLQRDLDRGHRDLVLLGEVGDGLDVGIARVEQDRLRGEGGDALDGVGRALRARPDREQARHAARDDVDGARQQRVVHGGRAVEGGPHDLDLGDARRLGVLLEQLVLLHQVELQVAHRELAGEADLRRLRSRRPRRRPASASPARIGKAGANLARTLALRIAFPPCGFLDPPNSRDQMGAAFAPCSPVVGTIVAQRAGPMLRQRVLIIAHACLASFRSVNRPARRGWPGRTSPATPPDAA